MEQLCLFPNYKIPSNKKIRLIELFGGIGAQAKAMERLEEKGLLPNGFEHYKLVEYDKYPVASYNAIHGTNFTPLDITKIHASDLGIRERERFEYIMTYSFPCQDISGSGKGAGLKKGSGTRSGLLWEVERLLNECNEELPQVLLMENVKMLLSKKHIGDFKEWLAFLESKGYKNFYQVLNSQDYGIPQHRERVFCVSILDTEEIFYGISTNYVFPPKEELKLQLRDLLEDEVDESFFLSQAMVDYLTGVNQKESKFDRAKVFERVLKQTNEKQVATTLTLTQSRPTCNYILIRNNTKAGYMAAQEGDGINISSRMHHQKRGNVMHKKSPALSTQADKGVIIKIGNYSPSGHSAASVVDSRGVAPTVMENHGTVTATNVGYNLRKLTPKECFRLMGFDDKDYEKASMVNSKTQLYKQAGNSIVVNVLEAIFKELL